MLEEEDLKQLRLAESLYHFTRSPQQAVSDQKLVYQWRSQLEQIHSPIIRECIQLRLEWQSLIAAIRQRQVGDKGPEQFFGLGRWTTRIRQHWQEPTFGLEGAMPLLNQLQPKMLKGDAGEVEAQMNALLWQNLFQVERSHAFTLETVVCFVLRWGIAEQQIENDAGQALKAFESMAEALVSAPVIKEYIESAFEELS